MPRYLIALLSALILVGTVACAGLNVSDDGKVTAFVEPLVGISRLNQSEAAVQAMFDAQHEALLTVVDEKVAETLGVAKDEFQSEVDDMAEQDNDSRNTVLLGVGVLASLGIGVDQERRRRKRKVVRVKKAADDQNTLVKSVAKATVEGLGYEYEPEVGAV